MLIFATPGTSMTLGTGSGGLALNNAEMGKISSSRISLSVTGTGILTVNGFVSTLSSGEVSLSSEDSLQFITAASSFASGLKAMTSGAGAVALTLATAITALTGTVELTAGGITLNYSAGEVITTSGGNVTLTGAVTLA